MAAQVATSEAWRLHGNEQFRQAKATAASDANAKRRLLWTALDCYKTGQGLASAGPKDKSLCCKNSAVVHKELAGVEWAAGNSQRAWQHTLDCVDAYGLAERHAAAWPDGADWTDRLAAKFGDDLQLLFALTLRESTSEKFVENLQLLCLRLGRTRSGRAEYLQAAVNIFADLASRLLHLSLSLEDRHRNYGLAYRYVAEMHFPLQEAARLASRNAELQQSCKEELEVLANDQRVQELLFRSRVQLQAGKEFLANLDTSRERWTVEAELAVDHLKGAQNLIADDWLDVALEAEICATLGHAYLQLFHADSVAERYLKRSVELVLCFLPGSQRHCRDEHWYSLAEKDLRDLQQKRAKREQDEKTKLQLDSEFKAIAEAAAKGQSTFLAFIYSKYPPTAKVTTPPEQTTADDNVEDQEQRSATKRLLLKVLSHYHPDKCDKSDVKTLYIREEITKHINNFFERVK